MAEKVRITRIETASVSIPYKFPWRNRHTEERGSPITHLETTVLKVHTDAAARNRLYPADVLGPMLFVDDVLARPLDMGGATGRRRTGRGWGSN